MKHKALSIHQPYVNQIFQGRKTLELRKTRTNHRGDLLICSTKKEYGNPKNYPTGQAIGIVEVFGCEPVNETHRKFIFPDGDKRALYGYVWKLRNPRKIKPFPVKGQQGFYYVDIDIDKLSLRPIADYTYRDDDERDIPSRGAMISILFITIGIIIAAIFAVVMTIRWLFF